MDASAMIPLCRWASTQNLTRAAGLGSEPKFLSSLFSTVSFRALPRGPDLGARCTSFLVAPPTSFVRDKRHERGSACFSWVSRLLAGHCRDPHARHILYVAAQKDKIIEIPEWSAQGRNLALVARDLTVPHPAGDGPDAAEADSDSGTWKWMPQRLGLASVFCAAVDTGQGARLPERTGLRVSACNARVRMGQLVRI
ncbi:hypothetical protein ACJZ2D_011202 [Fusarium nematophilum]